MATPVIGKSSGSKESLIAYATNVGSNRLTEVKALINEVYVLGEKVGLDPFLICVQSAHETGNPLTAVGWQSNAWVDRLNPAGLGITDSYDYGYKFANGKDAARALVVHHAVYAFKEFPEALKPYIKLDPRYQAVIDKKWNGTVKNWEDYAGKWASDKKYAEKIVTKAEAIRSLPAVVTGTAAAAKKYQPKIVDKWLHVSQDGYTGVERRYIGRKGQAPRIIVIHIQEGTNRGSWQWFHHVSASSTVLIGRDGEIWRLVPEKDAPWTNGDVLNPTARGRKLVNDYGSDPNLVTLSIETEGYASSTNPYGWLAWPKPKAQLDAVVWQVKDWMQRYDIDKVNVVRHADFNQVSRPGCPGDAFYNHVIAALAQIEAPVEVPEGPTFVKPNPIKDVNGRLWDGEWNAVSNGSTFFGEKRTVTAGLGGATCRKWASRSAPQTRDDLRAGQGFSVLGWVHGEEVKGESRWWVTAAGTRIHVSGSIEKPETLGFVEPPESPFDKIVNGERYWPIKADGSPYETKTNGTAYFRRFSTMEADYSREPMGDGRGFSAKFFVIGEREDKSDPNSCDVWLVTPNGSYVLGSQTNIDWQALKRGERYL